HRVPRSKSGGLAKEPAEESVESSRTYLAVKREGRQARSTTAEHQGAENSNAAQYRRGQLEAFPSLASRGAHSDVGYRKSAFPATVGQPFQADRPCQMA